MLISTMRHASAPVAGSTSRVTAKTKKAARISPSPPSTISRCGGGGGERKEGQRAVAAGGRGRGMRRDRPRAPRPARGEIAAAARTTAAFLRGRLLASPPRPTHLPVPHAVDVLHLAGDEDDGDPALQRLRLADLDALHVEHDAVHAEALNLARGGDGAHLRERGAHSPPHRRRRRRRCSPREPARRGGAPRRAGPTPLRDWVTAATAPLPVAACACTTEHPATPAACARDYIIIL